MSDPYAVFVQIITEQFSLHPDTIPSWHSILREIQNRYPGFNRSIKTLQRWYRQFRDRNENEVPSLSKGRKINEDLSKRIKAYILEPTGKVQSYRTTATKFQIPLSTARLYIKHHIGFQRKVRPPIPHHLTIEHRKIRIYYCRVMMKILEISRDIGYKKIITGDESYFMYDYEPKWMYILPGSSPTARVKADLPSEKLLLTIFLWGGGMCLLYDLPKGTTMTSGRFISTVMQPIHHWWKGQAAILAEDLDKIDCITKAAIAAAKQEVERIAGVDLSGWDEQTMSPYYKLAFVKTSESSAIDKIDFEVSAGSSANDITLHKPSSRQYPGPEPIQQHIVPLPKQATRTVLKPLIIKEEHKHLPPIQSMYASLLSDPTLENTSISQWASKPTTPFPTFSQHPSIKHDGCLSNIASLIQLLFGSITFKSTLLTFTGIDDEELILRDFVTIFHQLASPQVSSLNLQQYNSLLTNLSNDSALNPVAHNLEVIRTQFWGNNPIIDAYNTTITLRKKKGLLSTRYLEELLETIHIPSQPPKALIFYVDRSTPSGKKINTRFYFPVYDPLQLVPFPFCSYRLRGIIVHTADKTSTNRYSAIVKEGEPDKRWIAYKNGSHTVISDIEWPQKVAYGDDFDDECSSACLLLYEKSISVPPPNSIHDTYTPYKRRAGLPQHKRETESSVQRLNPLSTPDHPRISSQLHRRNSPQTSTSNSDSSSSSFLSSSTSSTLFSDDRSDSRSINDFTISFSDSESGTESMDVNTPTHTHSSLIPHLTSTSPPLTPHMSPSSTSSSIRSLPKLNTPPQLTHDLFTDPDGSIHIHSLNPDTQPPLELFLHLDNARVHNSRESTGYLHELPFIKLPHPPYSPDIAPCDFFLFGYLKRKLATDAVHSSDISNVVKRYLVEIDPEVYVHVFDHWHDRLAWVASHSGDYYPANNRRQELDEYKHLYHIGSNSSRKTVDAKPYLCKLCNQRYSSKPSLQTHFSIKHGGIKVPHPSPILPTTTTHAVSNISTVDCPSPPITVPQLGSSTISPPIFSINRPIVEYFSCIALPIPSPKALAHQLCLHMFDPHSNQSIRLSGTLLLDYYTKSTPSPHQHGSTPIPQIAEKCMRLCEVCSKGFSSDEAILMHLTNYHPERLQKSEDIFLCTLCSAEFATRRGLATHVGMIHSQKNKATQSEVNLICPSCKRMFTSAAGLAIHFAKMHPEAKDVFDEI